MLHFPGPEYTGFLKVLSKGMERNMEEDRENKENQVQSSVEWFDQIVPLSHQVLATKLPNFPALKAEWLESPECNTSKYSSGLVEISS